jgi:ABC-2 type transport system ATP-binding protein
VCKRYRKGIFGPAFNAIEDVSFAVKAGEAVGFIGHNGAGKSTTIRILMGLQTATSGTVQLQSMDPRDPDSRKGIAYVPESPLLYDHLTPNELLRFSATCHGLKPSEIEIATAIWLEKLGLGAVANKRIREFSKGMVQRTALAMALVVKPHLLILDEPLSGLDPSGRREIVEILSEYRSQGGGMLFSSHVLTDVEVLADFFLFIHKGRIRVSGAPGALMSGNAESFEIIIEAESAPDQRYAFLYGRQYKCEVDGSELELRLRELRLLSNVRLITVRSRNTLESAYFRFMAEAERTA